jgi:DNA-binding beta-propeller fold protein YncE
MHSGLKGLGLALLASTTVSAAAFAAEMACVNDAPNPYREETHWLVTPRPLGPINSVTVDSKDNIWLFDRCREGNCAESKDAPIFEISPDGKTMKNFGAGEFASAHGIGVSPQGDVWAADFQAKDGKGMQFIEFSPEGKVMMKLGKAGTPGMDEGEFNQPTGVSFLSDGSLVAIEGHNSKMHKSQVNIFSSDGKLIRKFSSYGDGDGQLTEPHSVTVDSQDRIFVADRTDNRISIFDKNGKFIANWKQFGRPSGVWINKSTDTLYVADSQSDEMNNPGCNMGIRVGDAKTGKVEYYIPPPAGSTEKMPPPEGIAVDSHGNIYAAAVQRREVYKYVKK